MYNVYRSAKRCLRFILPCSVIFLLSCLAEKPHTEAAEVAFVNVCDEANDEKIVAVKGYISLPNSILCKRGGGACELELNSKPYGYGDDVSLKISVAPGDRPGKMDSLGRDYSSSDFNFHTAHGDVGQNELVKLIGKVHSTSFFGTKSCRLDVEYAEKVIAAPMP